MGEYAEDQIQRILDMKSPAGHVNKNQKENDKKMANRMKLTKVITGLVRFSYLYIWEPRVERDGQKPKYSASLIIPKSDKKTLKKIKAAIEHAKEQGKNNKFGGKIPAGLETPLHDGDEKRPDDEAYANSYYVNAKSYTAPNIVDNDRNVIMDQDEIYSGCYGRASINFYPFNVRGKQGIACGLNHLMKVKDGKPLGGRSTAEADFDDDFDYSKYIDDDDDDLL